MWGGGGNKGLLTSTLSAGKYTLKDHDLSTLSRGGGGPHEEKHLIKGD